MMVRCDFASFLAMQVGDRFKHPETGEVLTCQGHRTAEIEEEGIAASGFFLMASAD